MSSRLMKYALVAGKQVPIYVAEELRYAGYKRLIDAIDSTSLRETVDNVKAAAEGEKMLTDTHKSRTGSITITSMMHPSEDPNEHSSILIKNDQGQQVCKGHVVPDENKQERAR